MHFRERMHVCTASIKARRVAYVRMRYRRPITTKCIISRIFLLFVRSETSVYHNVALTEASRFATTHSRDRPTNDR